MSYGVEKVLVIKRKGRNTKPWEPADPKPKDSRNKKVVTEKRLNRWIKYLVDNLYVQVGNKVMRQAIGIPMGTNCAPFLANLLLFMYELEFVTLQVSKLKPWHAGLPAWHRLQQLAMCTRYIDDLWNPLIPSNVFQKYAKKIYPTWLQLGAPEHEGKAVNYLDMTIWNDGNTWHSKLYDKKVAMVAQGLKLNKFPHPESKLSQQCKYGVITSQCHRYRMACTRLRDFLKPAQTLYNTYVEKGYHVPQINKYFERFMRNHVPECRADVFKSRHG